MKQISSSSLSKHLLRYFLILLLFLFTIFIISFHSSTFNHISSFDDDNDKKTKPPSSPSFSPTATKRKESFSSPSDFSAIKPTKKVNHQHEKQEHQQIKSSSSTSKLITWNSQIYLPVPKDSIAAFKKYQDRQKERLHLNLWSPIKRNSTQEQNCLAFTPECQFFREIQTSILFDKCCAEHRKLKEALTYTIRAIEDCNDREHEVEEDEGRKIKLFLDSGTLLSDSRDGGDTLVPWETDIDLGVVGAWPQKIDSCFKKFQSKQFQGYFFSPYDEEKNPDEEDHDDQEANINKKKKKTQLQQYDENNKNSRHIPRHHYFESCKRKKSANKSRDGTCSDAFYVYFAKNAQGAAHDTSRVEIWPFREDGVDLVHPTRKKLTVSRDFVLPLLETNCIHHNHQRQDQDQYNEKYYFWGIPKRKKESTIEDVLFCPHKTNEYLDNEYGPTWRWPKTIHWGENNAPSWNKKE